MQSGFEGRFCDRRLGRRSGDEAFDGEPDGIRRGRLVDEQARPVEEMGIRIAKDGERRVHHDLFVGPRERVRQAKSNAPESKDRTACDHEDQHRTAGSIRHRRRIVGHGR